MSLKLLSQRPETKTENLYFFQMICLYTQWLQGKTVQLPTSIDLWPLSLINHGPSLSIDSLMYDLKYLLAQSKFHQLGIQLVHFHYSFLQMTANSKTFSTSPGFHPKHWKLGILDTPWKPSTISQNRNKQTTGNQLYFITIFGLTVEEWFDHTLSYTYGWGNTRKARFTILPFRDKVGGGNNHIILILDHHWYFATSRRFENSWQQF